LTAIEIEHLPLFLKPKMNVRIHIGAPDASSVFDFNGDLAA